MNTMGIKIKNLRKAMGFTQLDIAKHVGVSKSTVSHWECGEVEVISSDSLIKLAAKLNVQPESLTTGSYAKTISNIFRGNTLPEKAMAIARDWTMLPKKQQDAVFSLVESLLDK